MITRDLRGAVARAVAAAGYRLAKDPGLRPTGTPGQYAASIALALGANPRETAGTLARVLARKPWIASAEITGPGYLTITVTPETLAAVADAVTSAGPACVTSDALAGRTVRAAPAVDLLTAPTWEKARAALAARLTGRLAAAAGATVAEPPGTERDLATRRETTAPGTGEAGTRPPFAPSARHTDPGWDESGYLDRPLFAGTPPVAEQREEGTEVARAVAFAGRDAVLFTLARAIPGKPLRVDREIIARHVPGNPAYAVRYAHARAASGVRWAVSSRRTSGDMGVPAREKTALPCPPADPGELALLDALSWLPERVAAAARRGRPDEFARYLEDLASVTVDVLSSASHPGTAGTGRGKEAAPGGDRLTLAMAARTGLAAGLGLLEVSAPDRL